MIKANELRVGSWINQLVRTDCGIHSAPFCCSEDFLEVLFASRDYENYEPIPITTQILKQCGFRRGEKWYIHEVYYFGQIDILINRHNVRYGQKTEHGFDSKSPHLEGLHQLQNLFLALTGTEIAFNYEAVISPSFSSPQP